jgi:hypothetical protein
LINNNFDEKNAKFLPPDQKKALQLSLYTLIKTKEDLEEVEEMLQLKYLNGQATIFSFPAGRIAPFAEG